MKSEDAEHGNAGWINGGHREAVWRRCVLMSLSAFVCALILFAALPAYAYGTGLKESTDSHHTLQIYGNANGDDTIDMRDVTYIKLVIFGKKPETDLCDANYDGRVSMLDVVQTKLIIVGKEGKLTFMDSADRVVTIDIPPKTVILNTDAGELFKAVGADTDLVVGVSKYMIDDWKFPVLGTKENVGSGFGPDYEKIIALDPDIVIGYRRWPGVEELEEKLRPAGIEPVIIDGYVPDKLESEIKVLGYIYNSVERAEELWNFWEGYFEMLEERTKDVEEKPKVYFESWSEWHSTTAANEGWWNKAIEIAGGINIAANISDEPYVDIDPEWVVRNNPDIIIKLGSSKKEGDREDLKARRKEMMEREALATVHAVQTGAVYGLDSEIASGADGMIGALCYAKIFYPELFADLEPKDVYKYYCEHFLGIELLEDYCLIYPETPVSWK